MTTSNFETLDKEKRNLNDKINRLSANKRAYLEAANRTSDENLEAMLDVEYDKTQAEIDKLVAMVWKLDEKMSALV